METSKIHFGVIVLVHITIKLVVPTENYIPDAKAIFESHQFNMNKNFLQEKVKYHFSEEIIPTEEIEKRKIEADVIVSRGILTNKLKEIYADIPVVDIPVQGIDLIQCLQQCVKDLQPKKVAVIGTSNMIYGADTFESILQLEIEEYLIENTDRIEEIVDQAIANHCEVIIGGLSTYRVAEKKGIPAMIIQTSKESLIQAYNEAKRIALVSRKEQEKVRQYKTILDHAYEGIIAVNKQGKISAFNQAAKDILHIRHPNVLNQPLVKILANGEFRQFILDNNAYGETLTTYRSIHLSVNKQPVYLRGKHIGDVVAFQDVTGIQDLESKIRKKIYLRGHVAKYHFHDIVHQSEMVKKTIATAKRFSNANSDILIIGETGTGKEMYAQSIHNHSHRKDKPFVAINCAALPEHLLESELFGYVEGAFTGASKGGKQGIFELAHQGTLFLDEIGEMSLHLQSRLLRVIQEKEVMRLGDDKVIPIDVRIIAATNRDLLEMVERKEFREDLYYRLSVLELYLPSLKESKEDIPVLMEYFLKQYTSEAQHIYFTKEALEKIKEYDWPGNIRQLRNFCERLSVLCDDETIDVHNLEQYLPRNFLKQKEYLQYNKEEKSHIDEKQEILLALEKTQYNREKAAKLLNISRTTLWRKMREYHIVE